MRSIVLVAFDGLQPSQVTPELMPILARFAAEGVFFRRHHPVYPTVTRLNAASMVTGCSPATHGIAGNRMVFREVDPHHPVEVMAPQLRQIDAAAGGRVLLAPTLADRLAGHGLEYVAVVSGTSGNAYCHNPDAARGGGATVHPDFCLPEPLHEHVTSRYGAWPGEQVPNVPRLRHATTLLLEYARAARRAAVSCVWYSEPDMSQHAHGVGSPEAVAALAGADAEFGRLLEGIEAGEGGVDTDVLVFSDHGYTTVSSQVEIEREVREAGFPPASEPAGVAVAPNGGSTLFYVRDADPAVAGRVAAWLMEQPWCGPVFASDRVGPIPGALPASLVGIDGPRGPDLALSFRWSSEVNAHGYPGFAHSAGQHAPGEGDHGGSSRFELRNTLIARGPAFRRGIESEVPSGNTDIAPTVMHLLGLDDTEGMDGRVLYEALADGPDPSELAVETTTHTSSRPVAGGEYRQTVVTSEVAGTRYLDEGNAVGGRA